MDRAESGQVAPLAPPLSTSFLIMNTDISGKRAVVTGANSQVTGAPTEPRIYRPAQDAEAAARLWDASVSLSDVKH